MDQEVCSLKALLKDKEEEISALKNKLAQLEQGHASVLKLHDKVTPIRPLTVKTALSNEDIMRYSRQLLLPELGVKGQLNLAKTSVLIVGCGGLGCPLAQYLAAAGIGRLGLLDYDEVELSNLHRQVLHGEENQGQAKALSAAGSVKRLNSTVECIPYHLQLTPENALQLIQQYDIVADCSDNVPSRYLVNDACVLSGKPLVSASALRLEGQLTVYNYQGGPCYRCLYPVPPPPETVTNCSDGGVLGVVPGVMGCFQALEVLKLASGLSSSCSLQLLMFDAQNLRFRSIRLRPKQADCAVCGDNPSVTRLVDYEAFCGSAATDKCRKLNLLSKEERRSEDIRLLQERISQLKQQMAGDGQPAVYVICKLGNDSQKAVQVLEKMSGSEVESIAVKDICGGLMAWAMNVDPTFPQY
uniref:Adenylyltransferase and sulfurtransferase MOCS3 n=1 Tax=Nothobranchius rachovii TaxID=451742 RepID=A0A1A8QC82_9TELE